jgi:hypothetical protein
LEYSLISWRKELKSAPKLNMLDGVKLVFTVYKFLALVSVRLTNFCVKNLLQLQYKLPILCWILGSRSSECEEYDLGGNAV